MASQMSVTRFPLVSPHGVLSSSSKSVVTFPPGLPMVGKRVIPRRPSVVISAYEPENGAPPITGCKKSTDHLKTICIFCRSSYGKEVKKIYRDVAKELGTEFVKRGINFVYGGRSTKAMGRVPETAEDVVPGVISVHKAEMVRRADAFIVLPGGVGSLDEILDMTQLGLHNKPAGLLNVDGSYDTVTRWLDEARQYGRLEQVTGCVVSATTGAELLHKLLEYSHQCQCKCCRKSN